MLIDLHAHTSGISTCCRMDAAQIVETAKNAGLDGIVLTNHYHKPYVKNGDILGFARRYVEEYQYTKACGEKLGCKVFFGLEISMEQYERTHVLVYGVGEDFVLQNPGVFDCSLKNLHALVRDWGGALIQAHPMRKGKTVLPEAEYLDGLEINCHPLYEGTHLQALTAIAREKGMILTAGGDFHADTHHPHCGVYLPDGMDATMELGAFLRSTPSIDLQIQEPGETQSYRLTFTREG